MALSFCGGMVRAAGAETVDRVIASVDNTAITRHDAEIAIQFELFLEGKSPSHEPDAAAIESERDRLIDQILLLQEADAENISAAESASAATGGMAEVRGKFGSEAAFRSALAALEMNEQQVTDRLRERDRIMRLIDRRLRPSAQVDPNEIDAYYKNAFLPELARRRGVPPPPLAAVKSQIQEILVQKKIDQLLDAWLTDLKQSHRVRVSSF